MSRQTIPARGGKAALVAAGQTIRIINTHGSQVVDTWAFKRDDPGEFLSMEHTRAALTRLIPRVGDALYSNRRRAMLTLTDDTSPGVHDTLIAACDRERYRMLGCEGHHDNCADNLAAALDELGVTSAHTPCPLNLFMNIPWSREGALEFAAPKSRPGDHIELRAEVDCIVAMSACPQDMVPVNGVACTPVEAHFEVLAGAG